ncbi:MAG TPA: DUF2752 domain-containing protein [Pyrinomonadaceae bacterium]
MSTEGARRAAGTTDAAPRARPTRARALVNRPGFVPGAAGALILAQLLALRFFASASRDSITVAGRVLDWGCWFRQHFGVPCPACGLTRSTLFTIHGQLRTALQLNPAGPLFVAGLCALAAALLCVALCAATGRQDALRRAQTLLRGGALAYAGLFFVVLFGHWLAVVLPAR